MAKKLTQKERVLNYMREHKYVTAIDGFMNFNPYITQMHTVIHELRVDGYDIETEIVSNKQTGNRYARWSLNA